MVSIYPLLSYWKEPLSHTHKIIIMIQSFQLGIKRSLFALVKYDGDRHDPTQMCFYFLYGVEVIV